MQFQTPTIANLLAASAKAVKARTQLLILLAILAGILSNYAYAPSTAVLNELVQALDVENVDQATEKQASEIFQDSTLTLLLGHLAVTAISTFLLIPWARASAPGNLTPGSGGMQSFWIRGLRSFFHMVAATGITLLAILFALPIVALLSGLFSPIGNIISLAAMVVVIWIALALTGTAHLAIAAEARDRRETFWSAFVRARLFIAPVAGSLAVLLFTMFAANIVVVSLATGLLPMELQQTVTSILSWALLYLTSALHVAALYVVPDFRDLRPI